MIRYDWDSANRAHVARHDVAWREVEEALNYDTLELGAYTLSGEDRLEELGMTDSGRILFVVTTTRGDLVRVVTAFDATRTQRNDFLVFHRSLYE